MVFNAKINYEPILLGIERINGVSEFRGALQINKVEHEWIPNFNAKVTINDFNLILEKLINFGLNEFDTLSLGLTAGLDSRLLLSYLLKSGKNNWITHTFGGSNLPDVIYSKNISSKLGFNHKIYDYEIPKKENLIKILSKYVSFTNIVIPVSETIQFGMHERFGDNKH
jgi:asparagine synthetase B (glutamine-hydrolysing)